MDPNATLARIRAIRKELDEGALSDSSIAMLGEELAELICALDGYLCMGGFLPLEWKNAARPITASKVRG